MLQIDDGLNYELPETNCPRAFGAIDTHLDFDRSSKKAENFDFVFAAQRDGAERLRDQGTSTVTWLPLACDPDIHRRRALPKQHDVCFVGNVLPGDREALLEMIRRRFPNSIIGRWFLDEMAKVYSASRIVFNRSVKNDVNMRVFEALACGSLLLTNDLSDNG